MSPTLWDELGIPVNVAFFFANSDLGRIVAFYPSPAGAMESLLPLDAWDRMTGDTLLPAAPAPDVEAVLIRKREERFDCYLVPIDACYELIGRIRRHWKGFDGGQEAAGEIEAFFAAVESAAQGAAGEVAGS